MSNTELEEKARELILQVNTRRHMDKQIAELRAQVLMAMKTSDTRVVANELGCVMIKPAYAQQRIDTESLRLHKPDWYRAFCKTVMAGESLQIIPVDH